MAGDEPRGIWSPAAQKLPEEEFIANVRRRATQPLGPATVRLALGLGVIVLLPLGVGWLASWTIGLPHEVTMAWEPLLDGALVGIYPGLFAMSAVIWTGQARAIIRTGVLREAVLLLTYRQRLDVLGEEVPPEPVLPRFW